jgi:hypothetical protein
MNTLSQLFKKHPISILFLCAYTILCARAVNLSLQLEERMKLHPEISGIAAGGEAAQSVYILLIIIGVVFFFIGSGYAIAKPAETKFHLWTILIVITEAVIAIHIG